jgi:cardiolipin synthase
LHVGSADFWRRAAQDIAGARHRVLIQAMTFEADAAGRAVGEAITANAATDRRVLVDDYTRHVINDTFLRSSRDSALRAEAAATWAMFDTLQTSGAQVRVTNPIAGKWLRYPLRNHKKLLVMDDVAWIGGINFSDHNFAWHDMMLRLEGQDVADWLAGAFDQDWAGNPRSDRHAFGERFELLSLSGRDNSEHFAPLLARLTQARETIEVISAYPTFPFVDALVAAARRGVAVSLHTPRPNNKPIVRDYLLARTLGTGIAVRLLPEMTHVKAALIDGEELVAGSSNFDFVSYRTSADYVATLRDPALIAQAEARLFGPIRARGEPVTAADMPGWRGGRAALSLRIADMVIARLRHREHIAPWTPPSV